MSRIFQIGSVRRGRLGALVLAAMSAAACGGSPTTPPPPVPALSLTCPDTVDGTSTAGEPVPITFSTPVAAGGAAPVSVTCTPASGAQFAVGSTQVTCTAVDARGQQATCGFAVTVRTVPRLERTRFLAFGDSLTEGKVSLTVSLLVDSPAHSYPAKLLALLANRYTAQEIVMLNDGYGGERVAASLDRFREALSAHRPEAVLLMHGVNDVIGSLMPGLRTAADGLEELTKESTRAGLTTFLATLPPLGPGPKAACPECIEPLNAMIREIAAERGAVLVDVHAAWGGRAGLMGADGIHPTEAGYEVIAEAFFDAIRRTLETPGPPN